MIASPTNIQAKTFVMKLESGRAIAAAGGYVASVTAKLSDRHQVSRTPGHGGERPAPPPHPKVQADRPRRLRGLPSSLVAGRLVPVAVTGRSRLLGLALLRPGPAGPGLLIPRCRSVHTFGMRFALEIVFLDGVGEVIERRSAVPPLRFVRCPGAASVLELPAPVAASRT